MNCPHCNKPLDHKLLRQAVNKAIASGKGSRPGAKGLIRNPKGRPKAEHTKGHIDCPACLRNKEKADWEFHARKK